MPTTTASPRRARAISAKLPVKSTTGATAQASVPTVAEVICPAAPRRNLSASVAPSHQTHGAVTPLTGGITNVSQLLNGGRNIAKGSAATFETLATYSTHLRGLDLHTLRGHAMNEKIVPIDDRERLIRRLETQWTITASRQPGRGNAIPARVPFTQEQLDAQAVVRNQLLRR